MMSSKRNGPQYILCIIMLLLIGYASPAQSTEEVQLKWVEAIINNAPLASFTSDQSGLMLEDKLYTGSESINQRLKAFSIKNSIESYTSLQSFQLHDNNKFELGKYKTTDGSIYYTIIGWRIKERPLKEIEIIYQATDPKKDDLGEIDEVREIWEEYANKHQPELIGTDLYVDGGYYFNRGKSYSNNEITDVYSYMRGDAFSITLETLNTTIVNPAIAFDIGKFQTRGQGLYVLIWKKVGDDWKLLLDFNF